MFVRISSLNDRSSHRARVLRYGEEAGVRVDDQLAAEEPMEIRVGGTPLTVMMRTPGFERELALGFLYGEGVIRGAADVARMAILPNGEHPDLENVIDVELAPGAPGVDRRWQRNFLAASSCGLCGVSSIEAIHESAPPLPDDGLLIDRDTIYGLDARLRSEQAIFARTGGLHAAGLFTPTGEPLVVREDIGRHNAVDKVVGHAAGARRAAGVPGAFWRDPVARAQPDPAAVGGLYDRYAGRICRFIRARIRDDGLAGDITAEGFLSALRHIKGSQDQGRPLSC